LFVGTDCKSALSERASLRSYNSLQQKQFRSQIDYILGWYEVMGRSRETLESWGNTSP